MKTTSLSSGHAQKSRNSQLGAFLFSLAAVGAIVLLSILYARSRHCICSRAQVVLADIFLILLISIVFLCFTLRRSLAKTLYTYGNIGLIGCILFLGVLAVVILLSFISTFLFQELSVPEIYRVLVEFPRHFSYYSLFLIFGVCVLIGVSNIALMHHEGVRPHNALSVVLAGFYIGGTVAVYILSDFLTERIFIPRGWLTDPVFVVLHTVIPLFLLLVLCYLECFLVGTAIMGWLAARQKPTYDRDYIIILGCSIDKRGGLLPLLKGRVNRAIRFAWEQEISTGKPVKYVPSGGQGPHEVLSEGSAMELYLLSHGAEEYEVFPEKKSRDTWENMCFSKKVIDALQPDAKVAFATTNYHMLRSGILARKAGLHAQGIAGDTKWYFWPNGFVREFFGILLMHKKAHLLVVGVLGVLCALIGFVGYFGNIL